MDGMQKDFDASLGRGIIDRVPVGENRILILQGLNEDGALIYEGAAVNLTVKAGQTTDAGTINMIPVSTIPLVPQNISATAGDSQVTIRWESVSEAVIYNIYMNTATGVSKINFKEKNKTASTFFTWTELTNGTKYFFVVTAENSFSESSESDEVDATP